MTTSWMSRAGAVVDGGTQLLLAAGVLATVGCWLYVGLSVGLRAVAH
jgi:hypothetical protein